MAHSHEHDNAPPGGHASPSVELDPSTAAVLQRGLGELIQLTEELAFKPLVSERYPLPLTLAFYGHAPDPERVRADVRARMADDPVAALEAALVLLELYECNCPNAADHVPDDSKFLGETFQTKRSNGWVTILGDTDRAELTTALDSRWQFKFISGRDQRTGVYATLNLLARYGFVYGRIAPGDGHSLGHFIEDYGPGLLLCRGTLGDLELTLSLAAMKMGVPAVVPDDYPFRLGRQVRTDSLDVLLEAPTAFTNIRRLLDLPGLPSLPDYLSAENANEEFDPAVTWGNTDESFYILRKGQVATPNVEVIGNPTGPMGVVLTAEAEPLDASDLRHIEPLAARGLSMMRGVTATTKDGKLVIQLATGSTLDPPRIGDALIATIRRELPKIERIRAEVIFDVPRLTRDVKGVQQERDARLAEVRAETEEGIDQFVTCIGCSPFAPDHVCVITPERPPQCGRGYAQLKAGALYGYDDMSNIHHRSLHANMNSFGVCAKGSPVDPAAGEWEGINAAMSQLTDGRVTRLTLHSLDECPHTGCSCFRLIMFKLEPPHTGIGVMDRAFEGQAPDGRGWADLHYALTGKQTPGMAGAAPGYLVSPKFLAAHGGWDSVVWVSPKIAVTMGDKLPTRVAVGDG